MQVVYDYREIASPPREAVVTVGNFDGVHVGHQEIARRAREAARGRGGVPVAVTFHPHPAQVLSAKAGSRADKPPLKLLVSIEHRIELLGGQGFEWVLAQRFDEAFSRLTPALFARAVLHDALGAREVFVGDNFVFGADRAGSAETLAELGRTLGFAVHVVEPVRAGGVVVSSSRIRERLGAGDVASAARLLGRPHEIRGVVVEGARRGRGLGFPTANLLPPPEIVPSDGVYAALAHVAGAAETWTAVVNVGPRPTFDQDRRIETHLLDVSAELYGRTLCVAFVDRLRGQERFDGPEALRAQIRADVERARAVLSAIPGG